eukprot:321511-Pyramimonas_sp.AAC.1
MPFDTLNESVDASPSGRCHVPHGLVADVGCSVNWPHLLRWPCSSRPNWSIKVTVFAETSFRHRHPCSETPTDNQDVGPASCMRER